MTACSCYTESKRYKEKLLKADYILWRKIFFCKLIILIYNADRQNYFCGEKSMYSDFIPLLIVVAAVFVLYILINLIINKIKNTVSVNENSPNSLEAINQLLVENKKLQEQINEFQEKENNYFSEIEQIKNQIKDITEGKSHYKVSPEQDADSEIAKIFPAKEPEEDLHHVHLIPETKEEVNDVIYKITHDKDLKKYLPGKNRTLCKYVSLEGIPGTGKTMLAEAIAKEIGKKIIIADYGKISSKYVGETEKTLQKLFKYADEQNAVLFIDEADTLLSSRIKNAQSSSDTYVNSTRNAVLTSLNNYPGIVIFASNFTENYDNAINSRIIKIKLRNSPTVRYGIWYDQMEKIEDKLCELPSEYMEYYKKKLEELNNNSIRSYYACCLAFHYEELAGRDIRKIFEEVLVRAAKEEDNDGFFIKYKYFEEECEKYIKNQNRKTKIDLLETKPIKVIKNIGRNAKIQSIRKKEVNNRTSQEKKQLGESDNSDNKKLITINKEE